MVAGYELAVTLLGGSWGARGLAPRGFRTFEDAANYLCGLPHVGGAWAADTEDGVQLPVRFRL